MAQHRYTQSLPNFYEIIITLQLLMIKYQVIETPNKIAIVTLHIIHNIYNRL